MHKNIKNKLLLSFILYLIILIWLVIFKANIKDWILNTINFMSKMTYKERIMYGLIPFKTFKLWKMKAYILNVIVFILFPIYLKMIFNNLSNKFVLLMGLICTLIIEITQIFLPFCGFAVEDIICNFLGVIIGIIIYHKLIKIIKIVNIDFINNTLLFMYILIVTYALTNTLINYNIYL